MVGYIIDSMKSSNYIDKMLSVVCCFILLSSCEENNKKVESDRYDDKQVGKYVYVDLSNTIHVNKDCLIESMNSSTRTKLGDDIISDAYSVKFVDTLDLTNHGPLGYNEEDEIRYLFCPRCVSDNNYKHMQNIIKRNTAFIDLRL